MLQTSRHLNTRPEEAQISTGAERRLIKRIVTSENELAIVALHDGDIIASLETLTDRRGRLKHSTLLGVSVAHGFRGLGLGHAMLLCCLEWAKGHPYIERVELHVHGDNDKAIKLYKVLGFVEEGRKKDAIRRGPQDYVDDILMCAYLGRKSVN
jgi:RimJ/RimL family protein N-acetyltransferase